MKKLTLLLVLLCFLPVQLNSQHKNPEKEKQAAQDAVRPSTISLNKLIKQKSNTYVITKEHVSRISGIRHVYLRQAINGLEVYGTESSVHIDRSGKVVVEHNKFLADVQATVRNSSQGISARQAISSVARQMGYSVSNLQELKNKGGKNQAAIFNKAGISSENIPVKLMYYYQPGKGTTLVWELSVAEKTSSDWWNFRVDASSGKIIDKDNWTVSCNILGDHDNHIHTNENMSSFVGPDVEPVVDNFVDEANITAPPAASYMVYAMPVENPNYGVRTLETNPENLTASPFGWHDINGDDTPEFTDTRGNNVDAYDDDNANNLPDGKYAVSPGGNLIFNFPLNTTYSAGDQSESAAITNLFYWSNIIHDVTYMYGFDEASGNFQFNNYGNGGLGADPVNAEAQDGSGTCNANFATPPDGTRPRMQMYVCGSRDGDLDNMVIIHEYGHGISNRLSNLGGAEQMGEGWSDYYGLMLTMEVGDTGPDSRGVGTWLIGEGPGGPGIRTWPYSTDFGVNPHTYDDIKTEVAPHGVGSVWAEMLWEMTWELIATHGFDPDFYGGSGGNNIALALVTEGLKLQPSLPGFVDGRDAILAADMALYGGVNQCAIWEAFARRGLGFSASQGSSASKTDGTEAYDLPPSFSSLDVVDEVCMSAGIQTGLTGGNPTGGQYSGAGVTDDGNGTTFTFDPTVGGPGLVTVTYTVNDFCSGAPTVLTDDINVTNDPPEIICVGSGVIPMTGMSTDNPLIPIPDNGSITATINVTENVVITDLDVMVDISHTWVGDLIVDIKSPAGTIARIIDRPGRVSSGFGCSGNDIDTILDDEAATLVEDECAPGTPTIDGSFIPNNLLSIFDGESTLGTWEISVSDNAGGDIGTLNSWGIDYDYEIIAPVLDVTLDASGNATVNAADFLHSVTVDCGGYSVLAGSPLGATVSFTCADIGTNNVPVEVTNDNGASSTCTAIVNVIGPSVPGTITCPADITQNNDPGTCSANVTVPKAVYNLGCGISGCTQEDDIESYAPGPIFGQDPNWETWNPGTPGESAEVSLDQAQSGNQSVKVTGVPAGGPVDQIYKFGNLSSGVWEIKYAMYVPVGNTAFTNIQKSETSGTEWAHQIQFNSDGSANYQVENSLNPFSYPQGVWFEVLFHIDLTNDTCEFFINGTSIITHPYSSFSSGTGGLSTIGSLNIYPVTNFFGTDPNPAATPLFYIDDISLCVVPVNDYNNTADASDNYPVGSTNVVWTAIDETGASYTCTQVITVEDAEDPVITCPANFNVNNDPGICGAVVNYPMPTATDNCSSLGSLSTLFASNNGGAQGGAVYFDVSVASNNLTVNSIEVNTPDGPGGAFNINVYTTPGTSVGNETNAGAWTLVSSGTGTVTSVDSPSLAVLSTPFTLNASTSYGLAIVMDGSHGHSYTNGTGGNQSYSNADLSMSLGKASNSPFSAPLFNPRVFNGTLIYQSAASLSISQTGGLASGSTFPVGTTTNTFVVTDGAGNTDTCSFDVTVNDTEPPIAMCMPNFTIQLDASGNASITPTDIDNGSTDNCGITSYSVAPNSFSCADIGNNTVTLTVTDAAGNSSTCTTVVTVEDNVAPNAICQNITVQLDASGNASIVAADVDGGSNDACGIASTSIDITDFTCANIGPNNVTLTVTDTNGNSSTCVAVVTVEDSIPPIIACPADITANSDAGMCSAVVTFVTPLAFDNCNVSVAQTAGLPSGSDFPVGVNTVEFTATDDGGNTAVCSFTITVTDNEPPTMACQNITIQLDALGDATITAADVDGGSTDNCGIATSTVSPSTFDCSNVGDNPVTLTVTDIHGNSNTCTAIVTVEDVTPPMAMCQDITVQLDPVTGMVTIVGSDVDGGSTDACGIDTYTLDIDTFDCSNVGANTVMLTVTDINGNASTCSAVVTVEDNTSPVLVCQDYTLELGADGTATLDPMDVIASNTDNCAILAVAVDITLFDCSDIGAPVTVQVFTADVSGNLSTCTAQVTVVDLLAPVITCPMDQTVDPGPGNVFYIVPDYFSTGEATAMDNCTDPVTVLSQNPAPGTALPDGTYTVTLTAEDDYGNSSTCDFELIVESVLGVGDNTANLGSVLMYPNPAKHAVIIGNPQSISLEKVDIFDIRGRIVKTVDLRNMGPEKVINVSEMAAATYIVIIQGENGQITKRLLKE